MSATFGDRLRDFALSVDIVDKAILDRVKKQFEKYVSNALGFSFYELLDEDIVSGGPGLRSIWTLGAKDDYSAPIKTEAGQYYGQTAYAFDRNQSCWIVPVEDEPLSPSAKCHNLWPRTDSSELPPYESGNEFDIRTSIILPLSVSSKPIGVLNLESQKRLEYSVAGKEELQRLANALALLVTLNKANKTRAAGTQNALEALDQALPQKALPLFLKPSVFVASANNADPEVVGGVRDVLDRFSNQLEVRYWKVEDAPGSIGEQILDAVTSCRFGICYLSERQSGTDSPTYVDNPNVLIEAGMLQALSRERSSSVEKWIPIREKEAKIPFDLSNERVLQVPRNNDGSLNGEMFADRLQKMVKSLDPSLSGND